MSPIDRHFDTFLRARIHLHNVTHTAERYRNVRYVPWCCAPSVRRRHLHRVDHQRLKRAGEESPAWREHRFRFSSHRAVLRFRQPAGDHDRLAVVLTMIVAL